ncbi:MAG TPA: DUF4230 domain-containing protein [Polyangiaceae bacterium]|jgi:hypothetical protein
MVAPPASEGRVRGGRTAAIAVATVVLLVSAASAFVLGRAYAPTLATDHVVSRPTPSVVLAMRDLSRLETTTFHMEKVIELTDEQSRLFGLVQARDQILLVAVGDVVAGIDMARLGDQDARVDSTGRGVRVVLPAPEVLSTSIDEARTHVFGRSTDVLAERKEELEGLARKEAAEQIEKGARAGGILDRARASAERTVRALLQSLGFEKIAIEWKG